MHKLLYCWDKSLFPILHFAQSVRKLSRIVSPPFAHDFIWSTCRFTAGLFAGLAPHIWQIQLSRINTCARSRQLIFLLVRLLAFGARGSFVSTSASSPDSMKVEKARSALFHEPNRFSYVPNENSLIPSTRSKSLPNGCLPNCLVRAGVTEKGRFSKIGFRSA